KKQNIVETDLNGAWDLIANLDRRVNALEAAQPKESVKEFLYSLRRSNNEQWDRISALEAEKKQAKSDEEKALDELARTMPIQKAPDHNVESMRFALTKPAPQGVKGGAFVGIVPGSPEANAIFEIAEAKRKAVKTMPAPEVEQPLTEGEILLDVFEKTKDIKDHIWFIKGILAAPYIKKETKIKWQEMVDSGEIA
ncbi:hypothetical protein VRM59_004463, partial [Salmonella enterica]|nr:hypothetical protein [Salmonella enterica]